MRAKVAKKLHAMARLNTIGKPDVEYELRTTVKGKKPTRVVKHGCTRRMYLDLKKVYRLVGWHGYR